MIRSTESRTCGRLRECIAKESCSVPSELILINAAARKMKEMK